MTSEQARRLADLLTERQRAEIMQLAAAIAAPLQAAGMCPIRTPGK